MAVLISLQGVAASCLVLGLAVCGAEYPATTRWSTAASDVLQAALGNSIPRNASPTATQGDLLYVSTAPVINPMVYIFTFPQGDLKGKLAGFGSPTGLCVDKGGDVFVLDALYGKIFEYRHGDAKPIATLYDKEYARPTDCSIDPVTGNLAVDNKADYNLGIAVYKAGRGNPAFYSDPKFYEYDHCGYDNRGNLFIDGLDYSLRFVVAELPKGGSIFTDVNVRALARKFHHSGGIKWDGKYVAINDADHSVIYQVRVEGSTGKVVGSTAFTDGYYTGAFWFPDLPWRIKDNEANSVIGTYGNSGVKIWNYPGGGVSTKMIRVGNPSYVTISSLRRP